VCSFYPSYAHPEAGHVGTIYQAAGWLHTGTAEAQALMALREGRPRHISSALGPHRAAHFRRRALPCAWCQCCSGTATKAMIRRVCFTACGRL
jgi:hypothetical protein